MSCERCGGFKVFDYFYGASTCDGFRCINCGAITNMRIITPQFKPSERATRRFRPKGRAAADTLSQAGAAHPGQPDGQP